MIRVLASLRGSKVGVPIVAAVLLAACVPQPAGRPSAPGDTPVPITNPPATPAPTPAGPTPTVAFVRPTPTPIPTFLVYVVAGGDTLTSIARQFETTARSIAYWNRSTYPSLDPDSSRYAPNRIQIGWTLALVPGAEVDPETLDPEEPADSGPAETDPPDDEGAEDLPSEEDPSDEP